MQFHKPRREDPEINLIPLIDVLVMTLIFLIVTTQFAPNAGLSVQLPETATREPSKAETITVTVDTQGRHFVNGDLVLAAGREGLRLALADSVGDRIDPLVVIQADARAPHEAVVQVMDSARRLGLTRITFATRARPGA